jgi:hypothetical protein
MERRAANSERQARQGILHLLKPILNLHPYPRKCLCRSRRTSRIQIPFGGDAANDGMISRDCCAGEHAIRDESLRGRCLLSDGVLVLCLGDRRWRRDAVCTCRQPGLFRVDSTEPSSRGFAWAKIREEQNTRHLGCWQTGVISPGGRRPCGVF